MAQKIIKIGNSMGVVVPKVILSHTGITSNDTVEVTAASEGRVVIQKVAQKAQVSDVDPKVVGWTDAFITKNQDLLERLKDK